MHVWQVEGFSPSRHYMALRWCLDNWMPLPWPISTGGDAPVSVSFLPGLGVLAVGVSDPALWCADATAVTAVMACSATV